MFRYTKVGKTTPNLPYGVALPGEVHLSLFDRFGPRESDSDQHFYTGESFDEVSNKIFTKHKELAGTGVPRFIQVINPELESENNKYVLVLKDEFFHLILNVVSVLFTAHEQDPLASFVIVTSNGGTAGYICPPEERRKNLEFLEKVCALNEIAISFLESEYEQDSVCTYPIYKCKNLTIVDDFSTALDLSLADISNVIQKYVLDKLNSPEVSGRKVYISRSTNVDADSAFVIPNDPSSGYTSNGVRLFSEPLLEEYLSSKGFEILRVDSLESIEDQIKLLKSVSVLVGMTGTGLTNALFLEKGSMVIELKAEILWSTGDHDANEHYYKFSYGRGHDYISLDVHDKQASTAITKLKKLFKILDLS